MKLKELFQLKAHTSCFTFFEMTNNLMFNIPSPQQKTNNNAYLQKN